MAGPRVGILLAAGSGSRFGSNKLLHPLADGTPLALAAARRLVAACDRCIAVLRPGADALAAQLAAVGCATVVCEEAAQGMGHSLAAGIRASRDAGGWLVALADMPFIAPASYTAVGDALDRGHALAAPVHGGRRGHPVGFAAVWGEQLAALTGDAGARDILAANAAALHLCPVDDPGILRDIDTPADLP